MGYPRISQQGLSVNVKLTVRIPSIGNDYKQHLKVSYSGGEPHDQSYFGTYQCTSWVALKINQMWGTKTTFWNKMFGQSNRLGDADYDGGNPTSYRVSTLTNDFVQRHGIYFIHVQRKVN